MIAPFFIFTKYYTALIVTVIIVILIIAVFTKFIAVTKEVSYKKRFLEMISVSLGVAVVAFIIGLLIRSLLNINI